MNNRFIDWLNKHTSSDATLKRISFFLFLICVLLVFLLIKLIHINNNLTLIAEQDKSLVEVDTKSEKYNNVLEVFTEEPDKLGDLLPQYNELTDEDANNSTTNEKNTTNDISNDIPTSDVDSTRKTTFVININSKKIHYDDCSFVNRMKEENKKVVQLNKNELNDYLKDGYTFCSTCGG